MDLASISQLKGLKVDFMLVFSLAKMHFTTESGVYLSPKYHAQEGGSGSTRVAREILNGCLLVKTDKPISVCRGAAIADFRGVHWRCDDKDRMLVQYQYRFRTYRADIVRRSLLAALYLSLSSYAHRRRGYSPRLPLAFWTTRCGSVWILVHNGVLR